MLANAIVSYANVLPSADKVAYQTLPPMPS